MSTMHKRINVFVSECKNKHQAVVDDEQVSMEILGTAGQVRHFHISNEKQTVVYHILMTKETHFATKLITDRGYSIFSM